MIPIWIRRTRPSRWSPDDPTWKSIQALYEDKKRLLEVTREITELTKKSIVTGKYAASLRLLGGKEFRLHNRFQFVPPAFPPSAFEVPCVFIESGQVSYGWRRLPQSIGGKIERVFHPIVLTKAFYAGLKEFSWASYLITKARILDSVSSSTDSPAAGNGASNPQKGVLTEEEKANRRLTLHRLSEEDKKKWLPFLRGDYGDHSSRQAYRDAVKSMTYQGAIESGCAVFRAVWVQAQGHTMQDYTRDGCQFVGSIVVVGERGALHLDVTAIYSPETSSIIGPPVIVRAYVIPDVRKWAEKEPSMDKMMLSRARQSTPKAPLKQSEQPPVAPSTESSPEEKNGEK